MAAADGAMDVEGKDLLPLPGAWETQQSLDFPFGTTPLSPKFVVSPPSDEDTAWQMDGPTIDDPVEILGVALAVRGIRVEQLFEMWGASSGETLSHEDFADLLASRHVEVPEKVVGAVWKEVLKITHGAEPKAEVVREMLKKTNALGPEDDFDLDKFHRVSTVQVGRRSMRATRATMAVFPRVSALRASFVSNEASQKYVALVAHNDMKPTMMAFVAIHVEFFRACNIVTTNSTGKSLEGKLGITVGLKVASGPLGGDQEIGALISKGKVGGVFFFRDPLSSHPHESDIQALTRLCDVHDVLAATNPRTGDALVHALETNPSHIENMRVSVTQSTSAVVDAYKTKQAAAIANAIATPAPTPATTPERPLPVPERRSVSVV